MRTGLSCNPHGVLELWYCVLGNANARALNGDGGFGSSGMILTMKFGCVFSWSCGGLVLGLPPNAHRACGLDGLVLDRSRLVRLVHLRLGHR